MENIPTPQNIQYTPSKDNPLQSRLTIEPCFPGYGSTIGNTLRRILLSSLPGAAVTGFKIKGVHHEFSTIPGVMEDVIEIMMNVKALRFKVFSDQPVRLSINVEGEKVVTAADIDENADVEVINKDQIIATLTKKDAKFIMELFVAKGRGYMTSETTKDTDNAEVDLITIDAIFNPIRAVGYKIENVRVGKMTNYERLVMDIETDGSITPQEAVGQAVILMQEQMSAIGQGIATHHNITDDNTEKSLSKSTDSNNNDKSSEKEKSLKRKPGRPKKVVE